MVKNIKLAYIGGGSKQWARVFMSDLAASEGLSGEIALYDIDREAAVLNRRIGARIEEDPDTLSRFRYSVADRIEDALTGADVVIISILPGTLREMASDVHTPEKYGIYQSVGDTAGPGGILRAMRTVPIYEGFARKIRECCPKAWVLNLTNPMSILVKTLYDVFPEIKAFGCCHEVFHAQDFLTVVLKETRGIQVKRSDIYTDASGINHFTWITEAKYGNIDLLALLPEFMDKYYEEGYYEQPGRRFAFREDPFAYGNKVKLDLFRRYGALAAAGASLYYLSGNTEFFWSTYQSLPAAGFNGIPVALLAVNNPIAVVFTGIFMAMLDIVGQNLTGYTAYNEYITDVIISVIVYLSAFSLVIQMLLPKVRKANAANANAESAPAQEEKKEGGEQA